MSTTQKEIKTYLPIFSGFYNTIWEYDDNYVIEYINELREENTLQPINYDHLDLDYTQYEIDLSINICEVVKDSLSTFIEKIEYEKLYSPKEYNFKNNSIDCIIIPKIDVIQKFIYDNKELFCQYLKDRYTSYDGFISHYSNKFETWESETNNFLDLDGNGHYLGSILEFIAYTLEINETDLYYDIEVDTLQYVNNLEDLYTMIICSKCDKKIEDSNIINTLVKYKKLMDKKPSIILCSECLENN